MVTKKWTATKSGIQPKRLASKRERFTSRAIAGAAAQVYREQKWLREALASYDPDAPDYDRRKIRTPS
jgi:hypothetical protein